MLRASVCDYSEAYILVSANVTVAALATDGGNNNIRVVSKNCATFTNSKSEKYNTQIDNAISLY